jgi:hypothetical protein
VDDVKHRQASLRLVDDCDDNEGGVGAADN